MNNTRQQRRLAERQSAKPTPLYHPTPRKRYAESVEELIARLKARQGHVVNREQRRALMYHGAAGLIRLIEELHVVDSKDS